ncbi:MAG: response regulator [Nitrospinota bacterium]|nr:response regulator [Nitrospinota bacterium]
MPNVLLANNEKQYPCAFLKDLYASKDKFNLLKAENGKEAINILESNEVDLVITNMEMPIMDGVELIAYLASNHPNIPVIAMSSTDVPANVAANINYKRAVAILQRPIDSQTVLGFIAKGLEIENDSGSLTHVSVGNVLQLIDTEQKTCLLAIKQGSELRGEFYFNGGVLEDASYGDLSGDEAAIALLSLDNTDIQIRPYPKKKVEKKIKMSLISLIMEGTRVKDEALHNKNKKSLELDGDVFKKPSTEGLSTERASDNKKGGKPMTLKDILTEMAGKIDGMMAISVQGMDGIEIAQVTAGEKIKQLAVRFAMSTKLLINICRDLPELGGELEETILQAKDAYVYIKLITKNHILVIVAHKDTALGMIRMVGAKYTDQIKAELS